MTYLRNDPYPCAQMLGKPLSDAVAVQADMLFAATGDVVADCRLTLAIEKPSLPDCTRRHWVAAHA